MAKRHSTRRASRAAPTKQITREPTAKQIAEARHFDTLRVSHAVVVKSWRCVNSAEAMLRVVSKHMSTIQHDDTLDAEAFVQITSLASAQVQEAIEALGANGIAEVLHAEIGAVEAVLFDVYGTILCASHALEGRKPLKDGDFVEWPQGHALKCAATVLAERCLPPLDRISTRLRNQIAEAQS